MAKKSIFEPMTMDEAYAKIGITGFAGSGKTYTGALIAIGIVKLLRELGHPDADKPAYFIDTERGSSWVKPMFDQAGIPVMRSRTRAFSDLVEGTREAEGNGSVLLVDSVTHFWAELVESYRKRLNRKRLQFQDWATIKPLWHQYSDLFVNSELNIVLCGRAGYEYDYVDVEGDDGQDTKELRKTGIRMKAEAEMGYEPSLAILMQREEVPQMGGPPKIRRTAMILKDRSDTLDGQVFANPTFPDFLPHLERVQFGQAHGKTAERSSESMFTEDHTRRMRERAERRDVCLDEIGAEIRKHYPDQTSADKGHRDEILEHAFGTRSWRRVETLTLEELEKGRERIWQKLNGRSYRFETPKDEPKQEDMIP